MVEPKSDGASLPYLGGDCTGSRAVCVDCIPRLWTCITGVSSVRGCEFLSPREDLSDNDVAGEERRRRRSKVVTRCASSSVDSSEEDLPKWACTSAGYPRGKGSMTDDAERVGDGGGSTSGRLSTCRREGSRGLGDSWAAFSEDEKAAVGGGDGGLICFADVSSDSHCEVRLPDRSGIGCIVDGGLLCEL